MNFQTQKCSQYNHPEIQFTCDQTLIPEQDINWLINHLEMEVAGGAFFKPDQTVQLGYMVTKIIEHSNELYKLVEPNMKDIPIIFGDSLTNTLKYFRQQQDIVDSCELNLSINFPSIQESIIVSSSFAKTNDYYLNREMKEGHQSGWFFRDICENTDEKYEHISLYEFSITRPDAVKFLGLPVGTGVLSRENDSLRIIKDEKEVKINIDSYLDQINSALD